jgi:hypothetical protein
LKIFFGSIVISIAVKRTVKKELNWFENNGVLGTLRPKTKCTNVSIPNHVLFKSTRSNSTTITVKLWKAYGFLVD